MSLSISGFRKPLLKLRYERSLQVLFCAVPLIVATGLWRPLEESKSEEGRFWLMKTRARPVYDIVLLGDSRILCDLSPQSMQTVLPDYRILNFGYKGGGLNPTMYSEGEKKLNPNSQSKVIVLGVTPLSLTPSSAQNTHFLNRCRVPKEQAYLLANWLQFVRFFEPTQLGLVLRNLTGLETAHEILSRIS